MTESEPAVYTDNMEIGDIDNYYGGLNIAKSAGKCYWCIEGYGGDKWKEIPEQLYNSLVEFEILRQHKEE